MAKKRPSAGLSKKTRSAAVKKMKAGKTVGGITPKKFQEIKRSAARGKARNPQKVAGSAVWKSIRARSRGRRG